MLDNYKISSAEVSANQVQSAPDTLTGTPSDNKRVFDNLAVLIVNKLNAVIEKLATDTNAVATDLARKSYISGTIASESNYTASWATLALPTETVEGTGIEYNAGVFTVKDSAIKALRITAGGLWLPVDSAATYVGYNRVTKNGVQVLYEARGWLISGGGETWTIAGIVPVAINDTIELQGMGNVTSKVRRAIGTRLTLEAIY